jgi:uncharacterized tellurite resistance protein B-like protein
MKIMDKLRNLLVMAASDGSLSESEMGYLTDRCQKWGLTEAALADAIKYALSKDAELTLPPRESDRLEMLEDLMAMMAADGELAETERHLFAIAAAQMNISEAKLNRIIDKLTRKQ